MRLRNKWLPNLEITLGKLNQSAASLGEEIRWLGTVWGPSGEVIETVTATASLANNEQDVVLVDAAAAATITLMNATGRKRRLSVKKIGVGDVTIVGDAGQLIDDTANIQLRKKDAVTLVASGGKWWIF